MRSLFLFFGVFLSTLAIGAVNCGTGGDDCVCGNCPSNQIKVAICIQNMKGSSKENPKDVEAYCTQKILSENAAAMG